jgi:hypothetical protein
MLARLSHSDKEHGMAAYGDRMTLRITDFGRKILIKVKRGTITCKNDKEATIVYKDSPVRNIPRGQKARKKSSPGTP